MESNSRIFVLLTAFYLPLFSWEAKAQVVLLQGHERGQGYAICYTDCLIVAPLHLSQGGNNPEDVEFRVTGEQASNWTSKISRFSNAKDPFVDLMVLQSRSPTISASANDNARRDDYIPPLSATSIVFREESGFLEYVPVRVRGENSTSNIAIEAMPGEPCVFQKGRSGALLVSRERRILGMLLKTTERCVGIVAPVKHLNAFLKNYSSLELPSHTYSNQLITSARCANEEEFFGLIASGADPNAYGTGGNMALESIVSTYGVGLDCRNQGPERRKREAFSTQEAYLEYEREQDRIECGEINTRRLRMIDSLSRLPGFRVDGLGGNQWTPLMSAVAAEPRSCKNDQIIEKLLSLGADPNHRWASSISGKFARSLDLAIQNGTSNAVLLLLKAGANPNLPDDEGLNSAMKIAIHPDPSEQNGDQSSNYCWDKEDETHLTKKLEYLVGYVDLNAIIPRDTKDLYAREYAGLTVKETLLKRLNCDAANAECFAVRRTGPGRCLEKMLSKLPR